MDSFWRPNDAIEIKGKWINGIVEQKKKWVNGILEQWVKEEINKSNNPLFHYSNIPMVFRFQHSDIPILSVPSAKRSSSEVITPQSSLLSALLCAVVAQGSHCRFRAKGNSMSPFIKDGDVVTVSPLRDSSPGIGDVVAFIHPHTGRLAIHRIVDKKGNAYLIKGDNAPEADGLVQKINILGFVTRVERKGIKVFIGLSLVRFFIALLTRRGLLIPLLLPVRKLIRPFVRLR